MAVTIKEDVLPGNGGRLELTSELTGHRGSRVRVFNVYGLSAVDPLFEAVTQPGIPQLDQHHPTIPGISVIGVNAQHFIDAADKAQVTITYGTPPPISGIINASFESGATLEEAETTFDADNLDLPYNKREVITVSWDSGSQGKPRAKEALVQAKSVPILVSKATRLISRVESADPGKTADRYVSRVNKRPFLGYAAGVVLCTGIVGRDNGDGKWLVTYSFAIDPDEKWAVAVQYEDREKGELVHPTNAQLRAQNGIRQVFVQRKADFNALKLPTH